VLRVIYIGSLSSGRYYLTHYFILKHWGESIVEKYIYRLDLSAFIKDFYIFIDVDFAQ
jgi:hypothetical protein